MKFRISEPGTNVPILGLEGITADHGTFMLGKPIKPNTPKPQDMRVGQSIPWVFTACGSKTYGDVVRIE